VVAAHKRMLGEEHPDTLNSMHALAYRYGEVGRRQEALQLAEMVVAARKRTLGEEHPDTLSSMQNLTAFNYAKQNGVSRQTTGTSTTKRFHMSRLWRKLIK
jgi:hypothetical protein